MTRGRQVVRARADDWGEIQQYSLWPEQVEYELIRQCVLFNESANQRARETGIPARKITFEAITQVRRMAVATPDLGEYRVRARLEQLGIQLSQATCGRLLALNRRLYGLPTEKEKEAPKPRKEMPYKSRFRHEWWSVDIRYIEHHGIAGIDGYIYQISILENYSRAVLASKLSRTQTQWDYLQVLFEALSTAGIPKGIVSDGGGQWHTGP